MKDSADPEDQEKPQTALEKIQTFHTQTDIIYPEIEPGIICSEMINQAYLDQGYVGEKARLHQMEPIIYERIEKIRLEFKNILRIDHLWVLSNLTKLCLNCNKIEEIENLETLVNLKELDLSFNYITKIENLEMLVNLEVLSLYNNQITVIENMNTLENLIILSIGNNEIDSLDGLQRFRFYKKLRVLNLHGNPIANRHGFDLSLYIAAILPELKFYEYQAITPEIQANALKVFHREVREIRSNEELEIMTRAVEVKEALDAERLSLSFVEHLNDHQLFETIVKGDEDGRILLLIGQPVQDLLDEYDKEMFAVTQEIYKWGLEQYGLRTAETKEFKTCLEEGITEIQEMGQEVIEDFSERRERMLEAASVCVKGMESYPLRTNEQPPEEYQMLSDQYDKITLEWDDLINITWKKLMGQELHLHEAIEEATLNFQRRIQEMVSQLVEKVQTLFTQIRDVASQFCENITEVATHYVGMKLAMQDFSDVPKELMFLMEDREAVMNVIAGMKDFHSFSIDEREDRLMVRSKEYVDKLIESFYDAELERNRQKILEINTFLDLMAEGLSALHTELGAEAAVEEN